MSHIKCPCCRRTPQEPVNLRCQHHPCYQCSLPHVSIHSQGSLQTKYKVNCPACSKKTVFYDLRHLILPNHANEQEQFATDKFLHKPEALVPQTRRDNYVSLDHSSQPMTRRGSIQSIANANNSKPFLQIKCTQHGQPYKYFCCDCSEKQSKQAILCCQCAKPHYNASHKLLSLRQSESKLSNLNSHFLNQIASRKGEVNYILDYLSQNKRIVQQYFSKMEQNLNKEFSEIFAILQDKYSKLRQQLRIKYDQNLQDIDHKIQKASHQKKVLLSLTQIDLKDLETHVKFYQTYEKFNSNYPLNFRTEMQLDKLPQIHKQYDLGSKITDDWIRINFSNKEEQTISQKKHRKQSNVEEQLSHRSGRDKQNQKLGISPYKVTNNRKLIA